MYKLSFFLENEEKQLNMAKQIAAHTESGSVIFLQGDLGAGKTTVVRGFLRSLGYAGNVKSPTYTLVEPYVINAQQIYHFDLYRLASGDELEYAGGRDYFDGESICLIEWPEKAAGYLPIADLVCELSYQSKQDIQGRCCTLISNSLKGERILKSLSN